MHPLIACTHTGMYAYTRVHGVRELHAHSHTHTAHTPTHPAIRELYPDPAYVTNWLAFCGAGTPLPLPNNAPGAPLDSYLNAFSNQVGTCVYTWWARVCTGWARVCKG